MFYWWLWNQRWFLWDWRWRGFDRLISCSWSQNTFFIQLILLVWIRIISSNQNLTGWCPRQHFSPSMHSNKENIFSSEFTLKVRGNLFLFIFVIYSLLCNFKTKINIWWILRKLSFSIEQFIVMNVSKSVTTKTNAILGLSWYELSRWINVEVINE